MTPTVTSKLNASVDWAVVETDINESGYATTEPLLSPAQCGALISGYENADFRSTVVMQRHGFGHGEYRYYAYPLPGLIQQLRQSIYPMLAGIANRWNQRLGVTLRYPLVHADYLDQCHNAGQTKPTPLQLKYRAGDYNRLHQDVYGDYLFPIQMTLLLSDPAQDFSGGEFILTEQRPRMQSRAEVVPLSLGEAVIFPVRQRPVTGQHGAYRVNMRHGVSRLRSGQRHTLGIIFHDAA